MDTLSTVKTLERIPQRKISNFRRMILYTIFCLSMFFDSFNLSALFAALPVLQQRFGLSQSESSWIMSAFQLTYASFLLISGRISDIYHPKPAFVAGVFCLGIFSLGAGFVQDKVGLIVLRAFCGICAALTIPSSLALIVKFFPDPNEQARAIGVFGGVGGVGNVVGAVISALFVRFANYHWIFYFVAIMSVPCALIALLLIPDEETAGEAASHREKLRKLDLIGVTFLTGALILFIFAVTSGSAAEWGTGQVIAPLIISILMIIGLFIWEAHVPLERAAVPPRTWFIPNFAVLFGVTLIPYPWWNTAITTFYNLWQEVYGWSVIKAAVHMFPIGVAALTISLTGPLTRYPSPKWFITLGNIFMIVAMILFCFVDSPDTYWQFAFIGLGLGSAGAMLAYTHSSIAIFGSAPPSMAGIIGAIFNCGCQLGAAVGLAVDISIETSIEQKHGGFRHFEGRRAMFYWQIAAVSVEGLAVLIFYSTTLRSLSDVVEGSDETLKVLEKDTLASVSAVHGNRSLEVADDDGATSVTVV